MIETGSPEPTDGLGIVLQAEQVSVGTESVAYRRLRVAKRIVTETRHIEVQVRREELVIEELDPGASSDAGAGGAAEVVLTLHVEEPVITTTMVRPVELVRLRIERALGQQTVVAEQRREEATLETFPRSTT